jgi:hypothetical protein
MPFRISTRSRSCELKDIPPGAPLRGDADGIVRLLFMTYNGFVMLAMTVGWFLGYLIFGGATTLVKETACH